MDKRSQVCSLILKNQLIEIDKRGVVHFNARPTSLDSLKKELKDLNREMPILIRADQNIALQIFVDVLDVVKVLEFRKVSLQTEEKI